jgi:mRNA interferase RelE/StbE
VSDEGWRVVLSRPAERELKRLPADAAAQLAGPIAALSLDPKPAGCEKVVGSDAWRIRVGAMRIVYAMDESDRVGVILRVARRAESTYRRLR